MTAIQNIQVQIRKTYGKQANRRLRRHGQIPAVLYGHGKEVISLQIPADQVSNLVRRTVHVVQLTGEVEDSALIREVQWDPFGIDVLHLDLVRVEAGERVETTVPIELRGDAPGTHEGGILNLLLHEIDLICPVDTIPGKLEVNVNGLHLGQTITAGQLALPEGVGLSVPGETPVVQCVQSAAEGEEAPSQVPGAAEPELIQRHGEAESEG